MILLKLGRAINASFWLIIAGFITYLLLAVIFPVRAEAQIVNNDPGVTSVFPNAYNNFSTSERNCDNRRHAQYTWISPRGSSALNNTATVNRGQNSVSLQFNTAGANCDSNWIRSANRFDQINLKNTYTIFTGPPTVNRAGMTTVGIARNDSQELNYDCSYFWRLRYVKTCPSGLAGADVNNRVESTNFTLNGLARLPVGTHVITVSVSARLVNRFVDSMGREVWQCVQSPYQIMPNAFAAFASCNSVPSRFVVTIRIPSPSTYNLQPIVECNLSGSNASIRYRINKTGTLAANNISVRLFYTISGRPEVELTQGNLSIPNTGWQRSEIVSLTSGESVVARMIVTPRSSTNSGSATASCVGTQELATRPYFRVYGGDVVVGRPFNRGGGTCAKDTSAGIRAYTNGPSSGAGVQFAASAAAAISGFVSASMRSDAPIAPSSLTLGNLSAAPLGRDGTGYTGCIPNYIQFAEDNGAIQEDGDTFNSLSISRQGGYYLFNGDITINDSIALDESWSGDNVPQLYIVVNGDINIAPGATRLDGVFVAQGGTINTCDTVSPLDCDRQLVVNGAFIADNVLLNRTNGDVASASAREASTSSNIAEVFNFGYEAWLAPPRNSPSTSNVYGEYDSIVGLPPIL